TDITIRRTAEMRYTGQGHEVEVEVPAGTLSVASLATITANFEAAYRALYSRTPLGVPIEALNFRVVVSGPVPEISVSGPKSGAPAARVRTSFTSIVREAGDLSAGVFDRRGWMVAQAVTGTPGHINSMALAMKHVLDVYPVDAWEPGDVVITNDPWKTSGHLNDVTI